ncbi:MAG TPA: serine O-acetyltransferase [Acidimicrobiales bacterium]|nr:serine O-acetyltransferase [Acidimicrobiales bacterium]
MLRRLDEDLTAALERDPAARSRLEVALTYPGVHALWAHRVAHTLHPRHPLLARVLAAVARVLTGVDIHPAAEIGRRVFIDHAVGVVIGETAVVGDDATLFHGVTLGGLGRTAGRRHPVVGARVLIGAGATLLGPITVGDDALIGANSVVLADVPAGATAVGSPARVVRTAPPDRGA